MKFARWSSAACAALMLGACAGHGTAPDPQTAAWWRTTTALSGDDMEGRDTGSPAYDRAAAYVAERFRRAGLRPAGDDGTFLQHISFRDIEVVGDGAAFEVEFEGRPGHALRFLQDITVAPAWGMPEPR